MYPLSAAFQNLLPSRMNVAWSHWESSGIREKSAYSAINTLHIEKGSVLGLYVTNSARQWLCASSGTYWLLCTFGLCRRPNRLQKQEKTWRQKGAGSGSSVPKGSSLALVAFPLAYNNNRSFFINSLPNNCRFLDHVTCVFICHPSLTWGTGRIGRASKCQVAVPAPK